MFVVWAVLRGLFNFNLFSWADLVRLAHVELHGFAGFVFGILILAAVPLYIATTVLTVRKGETPVKLPMPNCFTLPAKKTEVAPKPLVVEQESLPELSHAVPPEMRESFLRAHRNYGVRQRSVFNRMPMSGGENVSPAPVVASNAPTNDFVPIMDTRTDNTVASAIAPNAVASDVNTGTDASDTLFPIPEDFDVPATNSEPQFSDVPVFSEINFGDDGDDDAEDSEPADNNEKSRPTTNTMEQICELVKGSGLNAKADGDLVVSDAAVIALHDDADFWVADELDWFASGKQKPSPIVALLDACKDTDKKPVLFLAECNIMDFEKLAPKWRAKGIAVVQSRDDLVKAVSGND